MSEHSLTYPVPVTPRAAPMTPDERRDHLVTVTIPLLQDHGRGINTRLIAEAAGVAEGTIFRAFGSLDDLIDAAIAQVLDPAPFLADVAMIDRDRPLREVLVELVELMQERLGRVFRFAASLGIARPPGSDEAMRSGRLRVRTAMVEAIDGHADLVRVTPEELIRLLHALVFAGAHPHLAEGPAMSAQRVVDTVLDGVLARTDA